VNSLKRIGTALLALACVAATGRPAAAAQGMVTTTDIQRLQDNIYEASREIARLGDRDRAAAERLQPALDDARDEAIYLKVKLRKSEPVARTEYAALRDRIDAIRARARGESVPVSMPPAVPAHDDAPPDRPASSAPRNAPTDSRSARLDAADVPVGTEFDVRLQQPLSSATAQVEDRVEATTMIDLTDGNRVVVPAGSVMRGMVTSVTKATRLERKGSVTVVFDRITVRGRALPIRATVEQALESEGIRGETGKIGAGAGVGAILGAILGGTKGALAGILVGGGGVIAATEGKDVELAPGTVLRVRLDSGLTLE
jgi:hypothetical protein